MLFTRFPEIQNCICFFLIRRSLISWKLMVNWRHQIQSNLIESNRNRLFGFGFALLLSKTSIHNKCLIHFELSSQLIGFRSFSTMHGINSIYFTEKHNRSIVYNWFDSFFSDYSSYSHFNCHQSIYRFQRFGYLLIIWRSNSTISVCSSVPFRAWIHINISS